MIPLKIAYGSVTIRCRLERPNVTRTALEEILRAELGIADPSTTRLRYLDEEHTEIDVFSDKDLREALAIWDANSSGPLKLCVYDVKGNALSAVGGGDGGGGASKLLNQSGHRRPFADGLLRDISDAHQKVAETVVGWWLDNMPDAYFREIDAEIRLGHLRAFIALQMADQKDEISLFSKDKSTCTIIKSGNYVGLLSDVISTLPQHRPLREAKIYTAMDGDLVVDVFEFDDGNRSHVKFSPIVDADRANEIYRERQDSMDVSLEELVTFLQCCDRPYVVNTAISEIWCHHDLILKCLQTERILVHLDLNRNSSANGEGNDVPDDIFTMEQLSAGVAEQPSSRLIVVFGKEHDSEAFPRIARHLSHREVDILKASLLRVENFHGQHFVVLTCSIRFPNSSFASNKSVCEELCDELKRLPYLDQKVLSWMAANRQFRLVDAELITTFCTLIHSVCAQDSPLVFTQYHMETFLNQYPELVTDLLRIFHIKFAPLSKSSLASRRPLLTELSNQLLADIDKKVELDDCKLFFRTWLDLINATLKTNLHLVNRMSLAFRLEPKILHRKLAFTKSKLELPFGIFFLYGRSFSAFHVRFRDIARGGIRLVVPNSLEHLSVSQTDLLMETCHLAYMQQLKNKDIPEGGAKAIVLLDSDSKSALFLGAKAVVDGLLDLCMAPDRQESLVVDYFGGMERLFLGPDQNVTNEMITWICERAQIRGHPSPKTFMTSKPGTGINHKEFGVTSEGVAVFMEVALHHLGLNPRQQPFTVKITGGPEGNYAGNLIKVLHREYGEFAKIVAVADKSGVAEDPNGLNHLELLRLVKAKMPIVEYSKDKISSRGSIISVQEGGGSGMKARNTMPFRVQADVFIPAGGRMDSINDANWGQFFQKDSKPSSRLIVEGGTRFISPAARDHLSRKGVVIVQDSSTTKCGVISSSYEVLAGMLLDDAEFLSIKGTFVTEVLARLRHLSKLEALILFNEYHRQFGGFSEAAALPAADHHKTLPEISQLVSKAIIRVKEAICQSPLLNLYIQPLPVAKTNAGGDLQRQSSGNFFIASPGPTASDASPVEDEVDEAMGEYFAPFIAEARRLGVTYHRQFHQVCRNLLLEYLPPSLRAFALAKLGSSLFAPNAPLSPARRRHMQQEAPETTSRLDAVIPTAYKKRILATALACRIIYNEGIQFLDATLGMDIHSEGHPLASLAESTIAHETAEIPSTVTLQDQQSVEYASKIAEWSFRYLLEYDRTAHLIEQIRLNAEMDVEVKRRLVEIMERGGTRIGVELAHK